MANSKKEFRPLNGVKIEHLVAGVSGGVASTLLLHPLDLMKIRFAVTNVGASTAATAAAASRPKYNGISDAMVTVVRQEGFRGLYKGVTPNCWGAGVAWGLYFLFYNTFKTYLQGGDRVQLSPSMNMLAAAESGFFTLVLTNPIWVVKTRLCLQFENPGSSSAVRYNGMLDALAKTYKGEGIRGLYKGFVPGVFGISHGALQFMAYEELKAKYNQYRNVPFDSKLSTTEYLTCAALSKLFAAVSTYPYQVLRARLQDQDVRYDNLRHCIKDIWRINGVHGFYLGLTPNLLRVVPATAMTFGVYENVYEYLSRG